MTQQNVSSRITCYPRATGFTGPALAFVDAILLDGSTQLYSFRVQTLFTAMLSENEDETIRFYCTRDFCIYLEVLQHLSIQRQYKHRCFVTLTRAHRPAGELHGLVSVIKQTESKRLPPESFYFAPHLLMWKFAEHITCHNTSTNIALGFIQFSLHFNHFSSVYRLLSLNFILQASFCSKPRLPFRPAPATVTYNTLSAISPEYFPSCSSCYF